MQSWRMGSVEILSHAGMWSVDIAALSATLCHLTAYSGNTKNNSWERVSCLPSSVALSLLPWGTWWWCPTRLAGDSHGAGTGWLGWSPIGVGCEESPWGLPARSEAALISSCSLSAHHVMASVCLAMSFLPAWLPGQTSSWAGPYGLLVPRHLTWLGATGLRACCLAPWHPDTRGMVIDLWHTLSHSKGRHMEVLFSQACDSWRHEVLWSHSRYTTNLSERMHYQHVS